MKKLSALIICLLLILTCTLSGCAGFSVNRVKYYNEVLATVGDEEITRYELLNAYSNQNYGSTEDEADALNDTLDMLINREAIYQYAVNYKSNGGGANPYKPTPYQINSMVEDIFSSLDSQLSTYISEARKVYKLSDKTENDEESTSNDDSTIYKLADYTYTPRATLRKVTTTSGKEQTVSYKIYYEKTPEKANFEKLIDDKFLENPASGDIVKEIQNKYFEIGSEKGHLITNLEETDGDNANLIYAYTIKRLCAQLIDNEYYLRDKNGKPYSKTTNDLIYRLIERMYEDELKNGYLTNVENVYLSDPDNLSVDALVDAFKDVYSYNVQKYADGHLNSYNSDIISTSTDVEQVFYHPNGKDVANYGYFLHALFQFSDEDKVALGGYDESTYKFNNADDDDFVSKLLNIKVTKRNEYGIETSKNEQGQDLTLRDVLNSQQYKDLMAKPNLEDFVKFMFNYTQDTATLTSGAPYVVGDYDESNGETFSSHSSMQKAFTDEAIKLMNSNAGPMSVLTEGSAAADFCITSYGIHIVYYVGPVYSNDVPYASLNGVYMQTDNKSTDAQGLLNLNKLYPNPVAELRGKTLFDVLFDMVYPSSSNGYTSNSQYSSYQEDLANKAKEIYKVTKYTDRIKATSTSI